MALLMPLTGVADSVGCPSAAGFFETVKRLFKHGFSV